MYGTELDPITQLKNEIQILSDQYDAKKANNIDPDLEYFSGAQEQFITNALNLLSASGEDYEFLSKMFDTSYRKYQEQYKAYIQLSAIAKKNVPKPEFINVVIELGENIKVVEANLARNSNLTKLHNLFFSVKSIFKQNANIQRPKVVIISEKADRADIPVQFTFKIDPKLSKHEKGFIIKYFTGHGVDYGDISLDKELKVILIPPAGTLYQKFYKDLMRDLNQEATKHFSKNIISVSKHSAYVVLNPIEPDSAYRAKQIENGLYSLLFQTENMPSMNEAYDRWRVTQGTDGQAQYTLEVNTAQEASAIKDDLIKNKDVGGLQIPEALVKTQDIAGGRYVVIISADFDQHLEQRTPNSPRGA